MAASREIVAMGMSVRSFVSWVFRASLVAFTGVDRSWIWSWISVRWTVQEGIENPISLARRRVTEQWAGNSRGRV